MRITVLGCGAANGVPLIGNDWGHCDPANPRNRRRRPSILVEARGRTILVDTGPDIRQQLLDAEVDRLDAVIYTHDHADHIHGIDDLRVLNWRTQRPLPIFAAQPVLDTLERRFDYIFADRQDLGGYAKPSLVPHAVAPGAQTLMDVPLTIFEQDHGHSTSLGLRFGDFAYSTDVVALDETAFAALEGVAVWIVDATREKPHNTHAHLKLALQWIERVRPERAYLTHMNHQMDYDTLMRKLPTGVEPAYDGLVIERPEP